MYYLNEDIIASEILPRLPVKSLLKFRCVSKSWCALISDDKVFIQSHLNNSKTNIIIASQRQYSRISDGDRESRMMHCPLSFWLNEPSNFSVLDFENIDNDYTKDSARVYVLGSCNGLCCVQKGTDIFVWNPATKISYQLPDRGHVPLVPMDQTKPFIAGIGFNDQATGDYKVLFVLKRYLVHQYDAPLLYSSSTNSWKALNNLGENISSLGGSMKFLNGNLHWHVAYHPGRGNDRHYIYSFDLEKEVIGLVEQPNSVRLHSRLMSIGILDGYLSCTRRCHQETEIWIMKNYGVKESWHLLANIRTRFVSRYTPACLAKDGRIPFYNELDGFKIYDPKTTLFRHSLWDKGWNFCLDIYVESLVTPVPVGAALQ